jgi:DNA-binding LacI/PurR family transcriptional regulator
MPAGKSTTIKEVAQEAGVSTQTVSRVLNNRPDVAPETRQNVQAVIDRLGYQPSALARNLKQPRRTVGVVTAQLGQYGPMRRLLGIESKADELGYSLHLSLVHDPETNNGERLLNDLLSWQVEGVIWAVPEISHNRNWLLHKISQLNVPILFISEQPDNTNVVPAVSVDNRTGGRLAAEHLLAQGYQHIGLITGPLSWDVACQRRLGWQDALLTAQDKQIFEGDWSAKNGREGLQQLLQQYPKLDAVLACNDQMALGVLQAAHQLGLRVPEDLGVVGFDNTPEAAYFWPPLTTVRHQLNEQGKIAVEQLIEAIEAKRNNVHVDQPQVTVLEPELIVRASSVRG